MFRNITATWTSSRHIGQVAVASRPGHQLLRTFVVRIPFSTSNPCAGSLLKIAFEEMIGGAATHMENREVSCASKTSDDTKSGRPSTRFSIHQLHRIAAGICGPKTHAVDPLLCSCRASMRIVSIITQAGSRYSTQTAFVPDSCHHRGHKSRRRARTIAVSRLERRECEYIQDGLYPCRDSYHQRHLPGPE